MGISSLISSAASVILGLAAVLVSWRQYATAREQIRLSLFDKRYKVYFATKKFIAKVLREDLVQTEDLLEFWRDTSDSAFLFPESMQKLLDLIQDTSSIKRMHRRNWQHGRETGTKSREEISRLIDAEERETLRLHSLLKDLDREFLPFLDFREFRANSSWHGISRLRFGKLPWSPSRRVD